MPSDAEALREDRNSGAIALVTGASRGIGQAAALELAKAGFRVIVTARQVANLAATQSKLRDAGYEGVAVACDVTVEEQVNAMFDDIDRRFGRLDVLFNNAGLGAQPAGVDEATLESWERVFRTNVTGTFLCTRAAFALMKRQHPAGGRIINNGSISSQTPRPNAIAYNASKSAVSGITKSAALEGRAFNIACGQIDIGNVGAGLAASMSGGVLQADGAIRPEPTFDVVEAARAVVFMATLPLEANVLQMTVMATEMPFVGRG